MKYALLHYLSNESIGYIDQSQFDHLKTFRLLNAPINWVGRIKVNTAKCTLGGGILGGSISFRVALPQLELPPKTILLFSVYVTTHMLKEHRLMDVEAQLRIIP